MKWFLPSFFFPQGEPRYRFFTQYVVVLGVTVAVSFLLLRESCHLLIPKRDLILVIKSGPIDSYDRWVTVSSCQSFLCELASELYILQH